MSKDKIFAMLDALEKARVARLLARDAKEAEVEAARDAEGEYARPRGPLLPQSGDYVRDRVLEKRAGAKKGWRRRTPLEAAYEKGMLAGGTRSALERFEAGQRYACAFRMAEMSGRDSTDLDRVSGGGGGRDLPPNAMRALSFLAQVEARLSLNDRGIVRGVCGFEHMPSDMIRALHPQYRDRVAPRLCEALDALVAAMGKKSAL